MAELLFEIFCEEIPARMQQRAGQDLTKAISDGLSKAGLTMEAAHCFTGPRRLVFTADIPLRSPDISEERKGPRVGSPDKALEGFMKAAGLTDISQAQTRSDPKKGEFYVAVIEKTGVPSADILAQIIPDIMNNFPWPKSMKSGASNFRWVRPLTSMICLLGGKTVDFEVGGIKTGTVTQGHRRHGAGPFTVKDFADYRDTLQSQGHVMICTCERKDKILTDARKACADKGLELVEDEGLLNEVAGLTEWPVVILGDMDERFLELPDEVIRLTLKTHQKTFTVRDPKRGHLAPHYIIVANQIALDGGAAIKAGNGKVISARLSDAQFFAAEDRKHSLESYYDKLGTVVFHKKLGSIRDKAERVAALARELAPKVGADAEKAEQAARLAKCDLVTQTVVEFTSLQGQIGAQMYRAEGGDEDIATAIEQHYKPAGPSDAVPTNSVAVAVALADKLDTLVGFWAIDEKPTGSKDPYALRRAALGVVRIVLESDVRLNLLDELQISFKKFLLSWHEQEKLFQKNVSGNFRKSNSLQYIENAIKLNPSLSTNNDEVFLVSFKSMPLGNEKLSDIAVDELTIAFMKIIEEKVGKRFFIVSSINVVRGSLREFILDRLKVYLRDKGIRHDIIDAVFANGGADLVAILNRVKALQDFITTPEGENLLAGYKRAANILKSEAKKSELPTGAPSRPAETDDNPHGVALFDALQIVSTDIKTALSGEDYSAAMQGLAKLRTPIDAFFTHVQVISDDIAVRENNLRLLINIRDTARQIADFEAIQG